MQCHGKDVYFYYLPPLLNSTTLSHVYNNINLLIWEETVSKKLWMPSEVHACIHSLVITKSAYFWAINNLLQLWEAVNFTFKCKLLVATQANNPVNKT